MDDLLTAVKTVRPEASTSSRLTLRKIVGEQTNHEDLHGEETNKDPLPEPQVIRGGIQDGPRTATSPEEALDILRSQPDAATLTATLRKLSDPNAFCQNFDLSVPGPIQAQITHTIVASIVLTFWSTLDGKDKRLLAVCLLNLSGLNTLLAKLRQLSRSLMDGRVQHVADLVELTELVLREHNVAFRLWHNLRHYAGNKIKIELAWKELVNLLGAGKIIATIAEAEDAIHEAGTQAQMKKCWLARGNDYALWLGHNIAQMAINDPVDSEKMNVMAARQLLAKALSLGYPGSLIKGLLAELVRHDTQSSQQSNVTSALFSGLLAHPKRQVLEQILRWLSDLVPSSSDSEIEKIHKYNAHVSAVATLLKHVLKGDQTMRQYLVQILADPVVSSPLSFQVRRACLAIISSTATDALHGLVEKSVITFGDQLLINHGPILQQERLAQTLLLAAGYLHRTTPMAVLMTARSSGHMQGVSRRLDCSNQRARWLGMVVGSALSDLVDKQGMKMKFETDDLETEEATWYLGITKLNDKFGKLEDFLALLDQTNKDAKPTKRPNSRVESEMMLTLDGKPVFGPPRPPQPAQTEVNGEKVVELLDEVSEEGDDIKPYAKPDSDPEDSDEDATLVNRNKSRPPVYIRDVMSMIREDKDHDRFQMGIKHAASLIRRKTNFGTEVKDHAEELMRMLCNLQDPFDIEDFDEMRLQAMIAVLLSDVQALGPWLSRHTFAGEYSIAQRCIMLSTIGLGGRELAGFKNHDEMNPGLSNTDFPSKQLPPELCAVYTPAVPTNRRLEAASKSIQHQLIKPLALQAADQSTAHLNAVKVRTFSSRMDVERSKRKPAPNQLAKVFGEAFFFPLVNRYLQDIGAYGPASLFTSTSFLLVTFLKTLALLLHASGPATLGLTQVTAELWDLSLSLRVQAVGDISVLEAVLFVMLTLLECNSDKHRIADEHAQQLLETQRWVELVFERIGGGELVVEDSKKQEAKIRTLAAGVLVKTREVIETYQKKLFGQLLE